LVLEIKGRAEVLAQGWNWREKEEPAEVDNIDGGSTYMMVVLIAFLKLILKNKNKTVFFNWEHLVPKRKEVLKK
jgi:hypothetical protein